VGAAATKCLVCGADLTLKNGGAGAATGRTRPQPRVPRSRPGSLSPWLILGLLVVVGVVVGVVVWLNSDVINFGGLFGLGAEPVATEAAATSTLAPSNTAPPTLTPQPSPTETLEPTATPLPPVEYVVVQGDTCTIIAAEHGVSSQSIITLNALDPNCTLSIGQRLQIPQPTPTPSPQPTATLNANLATAIPRATYTVQSGDTLQGIAQFYGLTVADLMEVNGITDPTSIRPDQVLIIPLERRVTPGPTPTATPPPPWPAPNQLLPADGQTFAAGDTITLQWTSVGTLRTDEFYHVELEDVTCNCAAFRREATTDTKWIVPADFRPTDGTVHIFRWTVTTVRQRPGTEAAPVFDPAGATSPQRVFTWTGGTP
jgi:LysM repeat protein